jgi:glutamate racemase
MLGVFDSGIGGLTVVQELRRIIPNASIVYLGDTARAPYGGKTTQELIEHGREIINFLVKKGATAIVMACGTSSSVSLEALRAEFPNLPIVDTIRPAVKATLEMAERTPDFKPVFIATEGTIKSGLFARLYDEETTSQNELHVRACPMFAPMVEAGLTGGHTLLNFAAESYLADLRGKVTALILGCTHYPLLTPALTHALGEIDFINPATATAQAAKSILPHQNAPPKLTLYSTGDPKKFQKLSRLILKNECTAKKASL